jgi:hypothetical protein
MRTNKLFSDDGSIHWYNNYSILIFLSKTELLLPCWNYSNKNVYLLILKVRSVIFQPALEDTKNLSFTEVFVLHSIMLVKSFYKYTKGNMKTQHKKFKKKEKYSKFSKWNHWNLYSNWLSRTKSIRFISFRCRVFAIPFWKFALK